MEQALFPVRQRGADSRDSTPSRVGRRTGPEPGRPHEDSPDAAMIDQLDEIEARVSVALGAAGSPEQLEEWRRATIGRKGEVQLLTRRMGELDPSERPAFGKRINEIKTALQVAFESRQEALRRAAAEADADADRLDVTLPGRRPVLGGLHPSTLVMRRITRIFGDHGLPDLPQPRRGHRPVELRRPVHAARSPRARHAGHLLHDRSGRRAAHPHQRRPDPGDAGATPGAGARHPPGNVLPQRADHSPQRDSVPPDRGAGGGPDDSPSPI